MSRRGARVMMLAPGELFGGVETQLLGLCRRLRDVSSAPPTLLLFHDGELAARAREAEIDTALLPARHRYDPGAAGALRRIIRDRAVDVLHVHGYRAVVTAAVAGRRLGVPVVKTEHGLPEPGGGPVSRVKTVLNHALDDRATRALGAAVCYVTRDIMSRCEGGHAGLTRRVVYNGIDPLAAADTRRPPELETGRFNVGIVGRISRVKGIDIALAALEQAGAPESMVLHLIGTGPLEGDLRREAVARGLDERVRFQGFRRDVLDWIAHLDVLLMPSRHEGLPYTLLEAMSLGTPVIASRVGGLAEVLVDGETGRLVDVGDAVGFAGALGDLAGDPALASGLGKRAAAEQRRAYTLDCMTEAYLDVYASLGI